jgi:ABC-type transporter Mla MlaB component
LKKRRIVVPFSIADAQGKQVLKLEGTVTIRHGRELAAKLQADLQSGSLVEVDAGDLEDIDTSILQLLCSLRKSIPALSFNPASDAFLKAVERAGLRRELIGVGEGV